jgi:cyclase
VDMAEVSPGVIAFVRPEEGANAGLIRTADGAVVVDTTSSPRDMQELLDMAGVLASETRLVINTHFHSDHTWGNQLFDCRILAHRLCSERMVANLSGQWSPSGIEEYIAEREKTDPDWARNTRVKLADLDITLPTEVFEHHYELLIGDLSLEVVHFDAHTPGSAVLWLPREEVLFAGDLIFEGCYPFLGDADVLSLVAALKQLPEFGARAVVPGHGHLCGEAEISALVDYLESTWARTADHLAEGRSVDEAVADAGYPRYAEMGADRFHEENIRVMYAQIASNNRETEL